MGTDSDRRTLSFGPFYLLPARELLVRGAQPVRIGSRALGILVAMAERAGEVVSKRELFDIVWPNTAVEESSLRVHVAALRKALGDGEGDNRYIATIPGRGYRFVAPVATTGEPVPRQIDAAARPRSDGKVVAGIRIFGRDDFVASLNALLCERRLVSVVGPGGMGKTSVALAVTESVATRYSDGAYIVELARLVDPRLVPTALATALGKPVRSKDATPELLEFLQNKHMLIVLDNCEHLIDAAAELAERITQNTSQVSVLATSREPLRALGETVARLPSLEFPTRLEGLTTAEALSFPATQLFVDRAKATRSDFELDDSTVPFAADICRRLDGIPLAIELAAGRVDAFGMRELASLLDERFRVLNRGRRTALPRQQTLSATFDWSYELLSESEQTVLRRLSVFVGAVTMTPAVAVAAGSDHSSSDTAAVIAGLVSKSLVAADTSGTVTQYRLLESTRSYAREKLTEAGESSASARRHASYYAALLDRAHSEFFSRPLAEWMAEYSSCIDNVHVAIDWALSPDGDGDVGVALTANAVPLWTRLTLLEECRTRVERALSVLSPDVARGGKREMQLFAAFAAASTLTKGPGPESELAWSATLQIAERIGDIDYQLRALWGTWIGHHTGESQARALEAARKFRDVAALSSDVADPVVGDRIIGTVLWAQGELQAARSTMEQVLRSYVAPSDRSHLIRFQFDQRVTAYSALSLTLWLQGLPEQAMKIVETSAQLAQNLAHDPSIFHATALSGCRVALLAGDRPSADRLLALLQGAVARQVSYGVWIRAYRGEIMIRDGDPEAGSRLLEVALTELPKAAFHAHYASLRAALAQGLAAAGRADDAATVIEHALALAERSGDVWYFPELLRVKGEFLAARRAPDAAEETFLLSLDWARRQGALAWELRTGISLARLLAEQGRIAVAHAFLSELRAKFTEGFETVDLVEAAQLLTRLEDSRRADTDEIETDKSTRGKLL